MHLKENLDIEKKHKKTLNISEASQKSSVAASSENA